MKRDRLAAIMGRTITAMVAGAGCALVGGVVGVALRADLAAVGAVVGASAWLSAHQGLVRRQLRLRLDQLQNSVAAANTELARLCNHHARQLEALTGLNGTLALRVPLPPLGGYRISADAAQLLLLELFTRQPVTICEFGSGTSTVILGQAARALQERDGIRRGVLSFDHDESFAEQTRQLVKAYGLENMVTVVCAPLVEIIDADTWGQCATYSPTVVHAHAPVAVDLLFVDGPPGRNGDAAGRGAAVDLLADRLTPGACIVFDDARRDCTAIRRVASKHGYEVEEHQSTDKGLAILFRDAHPISTVADNASS